MKVQYLPSQKKMLIFLKIIQLNTLQTYWYVKVMRELNIGQEKRCSDLSCYLRLNFIRHPTLTSMLALTIIPINMLVLTLLSI
jgi:hypothetical protein